MLVVVISSIFALLLTYFESVGLMRRGMLYGFILVSILGAIHYDYGNDYMVYYDNYRTIVSMPLDLETLFAEDFIVEPGWALLCYLFEPIGGFFMMVAVLTIVQNVIIYKFIRSQVERKWWPMAVFIFLFNTSFYLMSFSMLRQWFVMCVFLSLFPLINEKKIIIPLIVTILCAFVHESAIVLILMVFIGYLKISRKILAPLLLLFFILAFVLEGLVENILELVSLLMTADDYVSIYGDTGVTFTLGNIILFLPFFVYIYYIFSSRDSEEKNRLLVIIASMGFLVIPFRQEISLFLRIGYYFDLFSMAAIPIAYKNINSLVRLPLLFIFIFYTLLYYFMFFNNPLWVNTYTEFNTIFSVI